jgi:hypothetical protein
MPVFIVFNIQQAYLQFASEEEAKAMARFYNANVMATVCGKPVRISHSQTYPTIQVSPATVASPSGRTSGTTASGMPGQA